MAERDVRPRLRGGERQRSGPRMQSEGAGCKPELAPEVRLEHPEPGIALMRLCRPKPLNALTDAGQYV